MHKRCKRAPAVMVGRLRYGKTEQHRRRKCNSGSSRFTNVAPWSLLCLLWVSGLFLMLHQCDCVYGALMIMCVCCLWKCTHMKPCFVLFFKNHHQFRNSRFAFQGGFNAVRNLQIRPAQWYLRSPAAEGEKNLKIRPAPWFLRLSWGGRVKTSR